MIIFVALLLVIIVFTVLLAYYGAYLLIMPETLSGSFAVLVLGSIFMIALFMLLRCLFLGVQFLQERRKRAEITRQKVINKRKQ